MIGDVGVEGHRDRATRWNGEAVTGLVADLVKTARARPGLSTSRRATMVVDAELWERFQMMASLVEVERSGLGVRSA